MFEQGEQIVSVTMNVAKFEGLLKAGLLQEGNFIVTSVRTHGETYDNEEYRQLKSNYIKAKKELEDLTYKLKQQWEIKNTSNARSV
jgi:hypothetical protein